MCGRGKVRLLEEGESAEVCLLSCWTPQYRLGESMSRRSGRVSRLAVQMENMKIVKEHACTNYKKQLERLLFGSYGDFVEERSCS